MRIGLYFGTYNPIHVGHLIIANHMAERDDMDQVWLVVTPQNPLKNNSNLLADYHRLALVKIAIDDNFNLRAKTICVRFTNGKTMKLSWNAIRFMYIRDRLLWLN